jgi:hypothetical protein
MGYAASLADHEISTHVWSVSMKKQQGFTLIELLIAVHQVSSAGEGHGGSGGNQRAEDSV